MFDRFRALYAPLREEGPAGSAWLHERLTTVPGYTDFAAEFAGATFDGGLYRVHDDISGPQAMELIGDAFPECTHRVVPFGYDWLGNQFAVDYGRIVEGQPQVLLFVVGTGEALRIPVSFTAFHEEEVVDDSEAALASEFFYTWSAPNTDTLPLRRDQCLGYRIPLFLGGQDEERNLEITDLEVYWSHTGQLRVSTLDLPPGTSIQGVKRAE
ncbi:hypothetical protein QFZ52_003156 [Arthrobacter woluwensis]|uniref:T6SS immunity protein Tdi1 domain-containing protein n=1 Tax=Arthrobacter woluwensis TaxID=156980 RepID=UPI002780F879|nr:T6SS immunity protein Tdi1 domain-containing protein [Arthrobacter woluwensis]MDQ0710504.1 hypothetical protein [Arthrobacter woluwensis]